MQEAIKIKEVHLGEEDQIIYLSNNDVITSSDGYGASYNNNYELYHQLAEYAMTGLEYLEKDEEIEEFKKDANNYLRYVLDEIESEGECTIEEIEKYKFDEFKNSFKVLKVIKF